nr:basic salivary proline-rich protein 2-like [Saimiri boliviensis boliviensis]
MLRLRPPTPHPPARVPVPPRRGTKRIRSERRARGYGGSRPGDKGGAREPTFRGFGGPAPRPGLGEGEGPPLGEEQCGRPRPSAALGAASRCQPGSQEPGRGTRLRGELVARGGRVAGPGSLPVGPRAPAEHSLPEREAPARGASLRACAYSGGRSATCGLGRDHWCAPVAGTPCPPRPLPRRRPPRAWGARPCVFAHSWQVQPQLRPRGPANPPSSRLCQARETRSSPGAGPEGKGGNFMKHLCQVSISVTIITNN